MSPTSNPSPPSSPSAFFNPSQPPPPLPPPPPPPPPPPSTACAPRRTTRVSKPSYRLRDQSVASVRPKRRRPLRKPQPSSSISVAPTTPSRVPLREKPPDQVASPNCSDRSNTPPASPSALSPPSVSSKQQPPHSPVVNPVTPAVIAPPRPAEEDEDVDPSPMLVHVLDDSPCPEEYRDVHHLLARLGAEILHSLLHDPAPVCLISWTVSQHPVSNVDSRVFVAAAAAIPVVDPDWVVHSYYHGLWLPVEPFVRKLSVSPLSTPLFQHIPICFPSPPPSEATSRLVDALKICGAHVSFHSQLSAFKLSPSRAPLRIVVVIPQPTDPHATPRHRWLRPRGHALGGLLEAEPAWLWRTFRTRTLYPSRNDEDDD